MTRLFDEAVRRVASLPPERQDELARLLLDRLPDQTALETREASDGSGATDAAGRWQGWVKGTVIHDSFDDPLDDELLDLFEGAGLTDPRGEVQATDE